MKKTLLRSILLLLVLAMMPLVGSSCSDRGPAPELEDVYDRLVEVVEASHEVNTLLFGVGLPTYARGDAEDELTHRYYGVDDNGTEYVTPYARFALIEDMKAAISAVYGSAYRESLMESLFTGYADSGIAGNLPARYTQNEYALYQSTYVKSLVSGVRVYDYASMEILPESYDTYLRVSVRSYTDDTPGEWTTTRLSFVYENGDWYLDSPSC